LWFNNLVFKVFEHRLPPQNIEAAAFIGGILLDPEAISRVSDRLSPEGFGISAHKISE